jgi:hypothetical protein
LGWRQGVDRFVEGLVLFDALGDEEKLNRALSGLACGPAAWGTAAKTPAESAIEN